PLKNYVVTRQRVQRHPLHPDDLAVLGVEVAKAIHLELDRDLIALIKAVRSPPPPPPAAPPPVVAPVPQPPETPPAPPPATGATQADPGEVGDSCRSRSDCKDGLRCVKNACAAPPPG